MPACSSFRAFGQVNELPMPNFQFTSYFSVIWSKLYPLTGTRAVTFKILNLLHSSKKSWFIVFSFLSMTLLVMLGSLLASEPKVLEFNWLWIISVLDDEKRGRRIGGEGVVTKMNVVDTNTEICTGVRGMVYQDMLALKSGEPTNPPPPPHISWYTTV